MAQPTPSGNDRTVANMDLVGGRPVVDFVNTVSDRSTGKPYDRLASFDDLVAWCARVGIIDEAEARRLGAAAAERPVDAAAALDRARDLREALFELFQAEVAGREPAEGALQTLNDGVADALGNRSLKAGLGGFGWAWHTGPDRLDAVLWPLALSAAELLTSSEIGRLKECAQDGCRWVFLDLSRNRSRRWCTMDDCGNRAKARRHYHRARNSP